jgi:hypothetical protein
VEAPPGVVDYDAEMIVSHPSPPADPLDLVDSDAILARAAAILGGEAISDAERRVRLHVVRAAITGTVIRPSDDSPEMRNPAYWILVNDRFVVAPGVAPVEPTACPCRGSGASNTPRSC